MKSSQNHKIINDLIVDQSRAKILKNESSSFLSLELTQRQLCDLELILNGGFSPLKTFMGQKDYLSVCKNMRLDDGSLWPIPIYLDISSDFAKKIKIGSKIALRDYEGVILAVITVNEKYKPNPLDEALDIFGTNDELHPGVSYINSKVKPIYISGPLEGLQLPIHFDFPELRHTPNELRELFIKNGWDKIIAFQTRNPMHRAHVEIASRAAKEVGANILIHPSVGMTKPGDVDHFTRVRTYKAVLSKFDSSSTTISLLPLAMRMAGPREALWHAIIRKNYGMTHFIVGRDHAGPGKDKNGEDFYGPYEAQELVDKHAKELGIDIVHGRTMVYVPSLDKYLRTEEIPKGTSFANISGTELRARLVTGDDLPEWFTYPEVALELRRSVIVRSKQGFCIFLTGLSGSGKSTIANILAIKLLEIGGRQISILDGDLVRKNLSSELSFSKEHRDLNIRRIGFVASEIVKHGGVAICAPIAPYETPRSDVRHMVTESGGFILAYVNTPIEICEARDVKGLYKKAREGKIPNFTGISDPYEVPLEPEIILDTEKYSADELASRVITYVKSLGYIA